MSFHRDVESEYQTEHDRVQQGLEDQRILQYPNSQFSSRTSKKSFCQLKKEINFRLDD
jgi:hypothetical protein